MAWQITQGGMMKVIRYQITGVTPLLFNNVRSMFCKKPLKMDHAEWEASDEMFKARLYLEGEKIVLPGANFQAALGMAAKRSGIKQKGKRSGYKDLVNSTLFILDNVDLAATASDCAKDEAFVGMNGTKKVLRIRPRLDVWSGVLSVTNADVAAFPEAVLDELVSYMASFVGIGDFRPRYGRFTVKKI
jgi:hypothetical protein